MRIYSRYFALPCLLIFLLSGIVTSVQARALFSDDVAVVHPLHGAAARDAFTPSVSCLTLETARVRTILENRGILGANYAVCDCGEEECLSFESPPGSGLEYLFAGGIWFGGIVGSDTLVTVASDGWLRITEFQPSAAAFDFDYVNDVSAWTVFGDSLVSGAGDDQEGHVPLNLRGVLRGHGWHDPPNDQTIIYDLVLTNIGESVIEQAYVGIFVDGDVYHKSVEQTGFQDDASGSLPDEWIAYIIDNDGDPHPDGYFTSTSARQPVALKFLSSSFTPLDTSFNWWLSNGNPDLDFGPRRVDELGNVNCPFEDDTIRSGTPVDDRQKYCFLRNGEWDYDMAYMEDTIPGWEPPDPPPFFQSHNDPRFLMSLGPVDLEPDSSIRILFTLFTAGPVHIDPNNFDDNSQNPGAYLAGLDFDSVVYYAGIAETLAPLLLDPLLPVTGLHVQYNNLDSVAIEWDPWVFPGVNGTELYTQPIPLDSMPYPGILPPWLSIDACSMPQVAVTAHPYRHRLTDLENHRYYVVSAAHVPAEGTGQRCSPVPFRVNGPLPIPETHPGYACFLEGQPLAINWIGPEGITVSHFNIYKFENPEAAESRYEPYYDTCSTPSGPEPRDSFFVDGRWYYYFAMTPYASMYAPATRFYDFADDSTVYFVTAVDEDGAESGLSEPVIALQIGPRTRDILAVIVTGDPVINLGIPDSIRTYFENILVGYDYAILDLRDSLTHVPPDDYDLRWWEDLMPFEMVLFDDGMRLNYLETDWMGRFSDGLEKYVASGGILAYFGPLGYVPAHDGPGFYPPDNPFIADYFSIDSLFSIDLLYYFEPGVAPAVPDTIVGCIRADGVADTIPDIRYDTTRYPFWPITEMIWDPTTMPHASAFTLTDKGEVTHTAVSKYPATSLIHGYPDGAKTSNDIYTTYVFGFHPWYMTYEDSRALVEFMMGDTPTGTDNDDPTVLPTEFAVGQNYPNPFNAATTISFALPRSADVRLDIFNILGQKVRTLADQPMEPGMHRIEWDSKDERGYPVASGIYLYRLRAGEYSTTRKMVLIK